MRVDKQCTSDGVRRLCMPRNEVADGGIESVYIAVLRMAFGPNLIT